MRSLAVVLPLLLCAGCAAVRPGTERPPPPALMGLEARTVVEAAEQLFDAMEARDTAALRTLMHPDAQIIAIDPEGQARVQPGGAAAWIEGVTRSEGGTWHERIRDPRVEVAGALATLWAPYTFHIDEAFSHCGTDAFQFVWTDDGWQLLVVTFTIETEGCDAGGNP
ncbi:MAG TPA: nuclear transport factor 2 family protein [Rhodothermales bacterium]|nr:nuclear transport factor 2 family protein [Rhodothermales bacterium]